MRIAAIDHRASEETIRAVLRWASTPATIVVGGHHPAVAYCPDPTDLSGNLLPEALLTPLFLEPDLRVVAGLPSAARVADAAPLASQLCVHGLGSLPVGLLLGNDLLPSFEGMLRSGQEFRRIGNGVPLLPESHRLMNLVAVLGARHVADGLNQGARVLLLGPIETRSLVLGAIASAGPDRYRHDLARYANDLVASALVDLRGLQRAAAWGLEMDQDHEPVLIPICPSADTEPPGLPKIQLHDCDTGEVHLDASRAGLERHFPGWLVRGASATMGNGTFPVRGLLRNGYRWSQEIDLPAPNSEERSWLEQQWRVLFESALPDSQTYSAIQPDRLHLSLSGTLPADTQSPSRVVDHLIASLPARLHTGAVVYPFRQYECCEPWFSSIQRETVECHTEVRAAVDWQTY